MTTEHTEPSIRDMWQEGPRGDAYWLDTTVTPDGSPASVTFRYVLGYGLINSDGQPVTYDVEIYRAYHAAGTNVPEQGWHHTHTWERFETQDGAQRHAEGNSETVGAEWNFEEDDLYRTQVELASKITLDPADVVAIRKALGIVQTVTFTEQRAEFRALAERFDAATKHVAP